jgi:hypothetical protein
MRELQNISASVAMLARSKIAQTNVCSGPTDRGAVSDAGEPGDEPERSDDRVRERLRQFEEERGIEPIEVEREPDSTEGGEVAEDKHDKRE